MRKALLIVVMGLLPVLHISGQLTGNNLLEYQLGNLPGMEPSALSSHYNQLNLGYRYKGLKASARYEHFLSQNSESSYYRLSQFQVHYRKEKLELKVGNFNETLGNGLLVRGYEIAGSIYEDDSYRSRYGFYRDMLGFTAKYSGDIWYFQALRGKSLVNTLPPTFTREERRVDLVEAVESGVSHFGQTVGIILMRNSNPFNEEYFYSLLFSGSVLHLLSYNLEYAHDITDDLPLVGMNDASRTGFYGSVSLNIGSFGLSMEYKNYHNLLIGSGINDPPTGIREQTYKVLNRSIHVPQLLDESGVQLEGYYRFRDRDILKVNYSRAVNDLFRLYRFDELFIEYSFHSGRKDDLTVFADYTSDEFKFEDRRYSAGAIWDHIVTGPWSTQIHVEYQYIERNLVEEESIHNGVFIAGVSMSPSLTVAAVWELSSDPIQTRRITEREVSVRHWAGLEASYKINHSNSISLFAGKRRGGPACTSGICYEVLDFEGIEIRLKTKF